jgi:hypothetical protein
MTTSDRPVCLTVIGWGTIAVAILMVFSGAMGLATSSLIPDTPDMPSRGGPAGFVFKHFVAFSGLQAALGFVLIFAGRSLLRLRRWASRLIEVVAWLLLVHAIAFTLYFAYEMLAGTSEAPPVAFIVMMGFFMLFTLAFWGIPLILTIRNLRSQRVRDVLV